MDRKAIVKAGYNSIAMEYRQSRIEQGETEDLVLLEELTKRLPKGASVLDAGCGPGTPVTERLSPRFKVTGVDISEAQVELARQHLPEAEFICQDMTELAFPDGVFDAVCSYYAIIHVPREEHRPLLQNFHRMLKPSGLVLLCMGLGDLPDDVDENYQGAPMYWSHYDGETNLRMLAECGFKVLWSKRVADVSPPAAHLFVLAQRG